MILIHDKDLRIHFQIKFGAKLFTWLGAYTIRNTSDKNVKNNVQNIESRKMCIFNGVMHQIEFRTPIQIKSRRRTFTQSIH